MIVRLFNWFFALLVLLHSLPLLASEQVTSFVAAKTGAYTANASITDLIGEDSAQAYVAIMPVDELITWEVYVPENYDTKKPAGVLVYISPSNSGELPKGWKALIDKYNLIWVAANESGNKVDTHRRLSYAIMALALIDKRYKVDGDRTYLSGFSGGGRVASLLAIQYPTLFNGAIYNSGANLWNKGEAIAIDQINNNRYVFIAGKKDFNLDDTKKVYRAYKKAGIEQIKLMVIPRMGHSNPSKSNFERAIRFLDQTPHE